MRNLENSCTIHNWTPFKMVQNSLKRRGFDPWQESTGCHSVKIGLILRFWTLMFRRFGIWSVKLWWPPILTQFPSRLGSLSRRKLVSKKKKKLVSLSLPQLNSLCCRPPGSIQGWWRDFRELKVYQNKTFGIYVISWTRIGSPFQSKKNIV